MKPQPNRRGWTDERLKRQSEAIKRWQPWRQSTEPRTAKGKARSSKNAYQGGLRPKTRQIRAQFRVRSKQLDALLDASTTEMEYLRHLDDAWALCESIDQQLEALGIIHWHVDRQ